MALISEVFTLIEVDTMLLESADTEESELPSV
jgi:hypothetical protein